MAPRVRPLAVALLLALTLLCVGAAPAAAKPVVCKKGFGKLVLANRKARMGRNPQTGEPIKIPAKRVVKFRLAKVVKDAILGGKK